MGKITFIISCIIIVSVGELPAETFTCVPWNVYPGNPGVTYDVGSVTLERNQPDTVPTTKIFKGRDKREWIAKYDYNTRYFEVREYNNKYPFIFWIPEIVKNEANNALQMQIYPFNIPYDTKIKVSGWSCPDNITGYRLSGESVPERDEDDPANLIAVVVSAGNDMPPPIEKLVKIDLEKVDFESGSITLVVRGAQHQLWMLENNILINVPSVISMDLSKPSGELADLKKGNVEFYIQPLETGEIVAEKTCLCMETKSDCVKIRVEKHIPDDSKKTVRK